MLSVSLGIVGVALVLPFTPVANTLGCRPLPGLFLAILVRMIASARRAPEGALLPARRPESAGYLSVFR